MINKGIKDKLIVVGGAVMLAGWVVVFIWGEPVPPISALSANAKATVLSEMNEFCRKVYREGGCNSVDVFGKQRWIASVKVPKSEARDPGAIAKILLSSGWGNSLNEYSRKTVFCKGTFGAVIEHPDGYVDFVVFVSSSDDCKN